MSSVSEQEKNCLPEWWNVVSFYGYIHKAKQRHFNCLNDKILSALHIGKRGQTHEHKTYAGFNSKQRTLALK